jgi:hypothetical protein
VYVDAHEEPDSINWQEFSTAFHLHHVPQGIIKMKKKEFQDLKQGSMSVSEYVTHFTQLSHYAPGDVDTNEKKQDCFLNGLNDGLAYTLEACDFENFQDMVNKALVLKTIVERWSARESKSAVKPGLRNKSGAPTCMPQYIHEVMSSMVNNI